jgi:DNA-binding CsgD family transcriptional regulator
MNEPGKRTTPEFLLAETISSLHTNQFTLDFPNWLRSCISFGNLVILAYFQDQPPVLLMTESIGSRGIKKIQKDYLTSAYLLDPFHDLHIERVPSGVYWLNQIAPDNFLRSRYFLEYYRKMQITDEIGFIGYPSKGVSLHICLGRDDASNNKFSSREMSMARNIAPIVASLAKAHWRGLISSGEYVEGKLTSKLISVIRRDLDISLSPRQAEVAMLILRGHSSTSIGLRLGISYQTVKVFRKQLYKKCKISSQAELFNLMLPMIGYH